MEDSVRVMQQLHDTIKKTEKAADGMLQSYMAAVMQRNNVGIMLIDRVDEQCVLQEKIHILQHAETKGMPVLPLNSTSQSQALPLQMGSLSSSTLALEHIVLCSKHSY